MIDRTQSTASWNLTTAVAACTILEQIAPNFGMHIGLTGGCLYKDGDRKEGA